MPAEVAKFTELAERKHTFGLTRREREVVRHAAGLTDRRIAERLVVSVRTVESHLAAAYRKLAIKLPAGAGKPLRLTMGACRRLPSGSKCALTCWNTATPWP